MKYGYARVSTDDQAVSASAKTNSTTANISWLSLV